MNTMRRLRVYADTSVFGGCFDEEFAEASRTFFDQVRSARFILVTSPIVEAEMEAAPSDVQNLFRHTLESAEVVDVSEEALRLHTAYLEAGIVSPQSATDALHVALATVSACTLIVSWNFRHIVHFEKIPLYNAANVLNGFEKIAIYSPREVLEYEDQDL